MLLLASMMLTFIVPVNAFYPCPSTELIQATLESPGELRVFDSEGRITGLVNGKVVNEIPFSNYADNTVTLSSPRDSYRYEVVGITQGVYSLRATGVTGQGNITFVAIDIPTSPTATHRYLIDWVALSKGEKGVTVEIDSDGDGMFERDITAGAALARDQFMFAARAADMNRDGVVNVLDITLVAVAFGSKPGNPKWNAMADLNNDNVIDILDVSLIAKDYGKTA